MRVSVAPIPVHVRITGPHLLQGMVEQVINVHTRAAGSLACSRCIPGRHGPRRWRGRGGAVSRGRGRHAPVPGEGQSLGVAAERPMRARLWLTHPGKGYLALHMTFEWRNDCAQRMRPKAIGTPPFILHLSGGMLQGDTAGCRAALLDGLTAAAAAQVCVPQVPSCRAL